MAQRAQRDQQDPPALQAAPQAPLVQPARLEPPEPLAQRALEPRAPPEPPAQMEPREPQVLPDLTAPPEPLALALPELQVPQELAQQVPLEQREQPALV